MARMNQAMNDLMRYNAALLPGERSGFDKSHSHTTTFDSGYLIPLMWDRVIPGSEKKIRYSGLARAATPLHPTMDEAFLDVWAFYIPDRLWWTHAKEFYGENLDASFNPDGQYRMPHLTIDRYMVQVQDDSIETADPDCGIGSLNDYFGFPVGDVGWIQTQGVELSDNQRTWVTAGLHRMYQKIWNEHFRNTSVQPALRLNDGDIVTSEEWQVIKKLRKVNKFPDYFTTLLREPQAGDNVYLPLGAWAPVVTRDVEVDPTNYRSDSEGIEELPSMKVRNAVDYGIFTGPNTSGLIGIGPGAGSGDAYEVKQDAVNNYDFSGESFAPSNLWANLGSASGTSINQLRSAITVQQLLERDAVAGKYYQKLLQAHFGVLTPDATLQKSELLGQSRTRVGMRQVLQTSSSTEQDALGTTGAVSVTNVVNEWIMNKAFTEPGFIMVLGAVRTLTSYSQGVDCLLQKLDRYDHFYPVFDHIGNQPVYTSEIYAPGNATISNGSNITFDRVLGYKPAWQEYRYKSNRVSGLMRPDVPGTLSSWNYSSYFDNAPVLNGEFIAADPELVDRTIAVPSQPQFILDSYFEYHDYNPMSVDSMPGLLSL